ncbi:MAG: choice-of-anchor J domain-containing protein, partial [Candidatus Marinimicrobia bacterium]|nr:choice-of-anchor J domain-containing protein [Candidatus Neomarinimicrobiota bacterium]
TDSTRLMIRASDNIFFDINNGKIIIQNANLPSISLTDEMIELSLPNDSLSTISIGVTNNGEVASVLSYQSYPGTDFQFDVGFDDGNLLDGWSTSTNADCENPGWFISDDASSSYFTIPTGDGYYIATNDDACNSDGSNDMLFSGPIQLPDAHISLSFLRYFSAGFSQSLHVLISTDNWETSTELLNLGYWEGNDEEWLEETINLNAYAGEVVDIAFHSNDNGNWASGAALDDIRLGVIPTWINSDGSGYVNYMETSQIDISINANGMEPGFYESKVVVQSMTTDEKDTVDLQLTVEDAIVGLDQSTIPLVFSLSQNYPNPFNPITKIDYGLPEEAYVSLVIFDILGREVVTLVNGLQDPGYRSMTWNGTDVFGRNVSAGMYFYLLQAGEFKKVNKMILLK